MEAQSPSSSPKKEKNDKEFGKDLSSDKDDELAAGSSREVQSTAEQSTNRNKREEPDASRLAKRAREEKEEEGEGRVAAAPDDYFNDPKYIELKGRLESVRSTRMLEPKPDLRRGIKEQVYGEETPGERRDRMTRRMTRRKTKNWEVDYVIEMTARAKHDKDPRRSLGDPIKDNNRLLIKWTDFETPTFGNKEDIKEAKVVIGNFEDRVAMLDLLEYYIRKKEGGNDKFEKLYPMRYVEYEDGDKDGYVGEDHPLYLNNLMALEYEFNIDNEKYDCPSIFIVDWTKKKDGAREGNDASLKKLKFTHETKMTEEVKELLETLKVARSFHDLKCTSSCSSCNLTKSTNDVSSCCGLVSSIKKNRVGSPEFIEVDENGKFVEASTWWLDTVIECDSECGCTKEQCKNRTVQKGRKVRLCIFRHPEKGWILRSMDEIMEGGFIAEYVGEMRLGPSEDPMESTYDMSLVWGVKSENGKPLFINGYAVGGELRFASHSCEPNSKLITYFVDRRGVYLNRPGIIALKNLPIGEEITYDYFFGKDLKDDLDYTKLFDACLCGSKKCRFSKRKMGMQKKKWEKNKLKEEEEKRRRKEEKNGRGKENQGRKN